MDKFEAYQQDLASGRMRIGVMGLGYVGLPLSLALARIASVVGYDRDPERVAALEAGQSPLPHIPSDRVQEARAAMRLHPTTQAERLGTCQAVIICVPTPLGPHKEPDLGCVELAGRALAQHLRPDTLVVLESTTYPGTTQEVLRGILDQAGVPYHLAYSPEREDPGNDGHTVLSTAKVVGADDREAGARACLLYTAAGIHVHPVSSSRVAEMSKLLENIFRCVNIALVNELKMVCHAMGLDIWEVIRAASSKGFGFMPFYPGPGLGGHCIPVDPYYLSWKAREYGVPTRFIELSGEINGRMPAYVVDRLVEHLSRSGAGLRDKTVLLVGIAYKPGVGDCREAPSLAVRRRLGEMGARVLYHDPLVPQAPWGDASLDVDTQSLRDVDAAIVLTPHPGMSLQFLAQIPITVDTRNVVAAADVPCLVDA